MVEYLMKKFGLPKLAEYTRAKQFARDNGHQAVVSLLDSASGEYLERADYGRSQAWNGSSVTYTSDLALSEARDRPFLAPNRYLEYSHHQTTLQSTSDVITDIHDEKFGADGAMLDNIHHYQLSSTISSETRISKRPYIQGDCEELTGSDSTSKRQKRKHQVTCKEAGCGKSYPRQGRLKRHHNTAHANLSFQCELCEKTCGRKDTLAQHITSKHNC
ncbi:hypothetical protein WAI453_011509 [Rhynchosporium graminicola]|uniref:C2H2-type domain-containing protein n=1 Tax=Rhynchosporium graminicola TaxID=2792576 RepID=A0A1E1L1S0_9HELO|nr:uncharacterized protein RCO7_09982 [Rhynchosporium commune]